MSDDEIKKLKNKEIIIKRIRSSFKKNWENKKNLELKDKIEKKIKLTNESKKKTKIPIFNELNDVWLNF
jgi:hypothetical protein